MRMRLVGGLACSLVLGTSVCHAASVCVSPGGTGGCLASIQQAVDTVAPRGRVDVAAGTYGESVTIPSGAAIQIYGAGAGLTVIDGIDGDPVLHVTAFSSPPQPASVAISDVTLTGGAQGVDVEQAGGLPGRASISRCIISGNTAEGVVVRGSLKMTESTVSNNGDDGIQVVFGRAKIDRSTISGNLGDGIWCPGGGCLIRTSTISGNAGTGLVMGGTPRVMVRATTIAANGIGADLHPNSRVQSTIIADSTPGPDVAAASWFTSRGYNLFETVDPSALIEGNTATDLTTVDPVLGPLQDNGGPTETHELLAGSPALETSLVSCGRADQRLVSRGASPCDRGAFEAP